MFNAQSHNGDREQKPALFDDRVQRACHFSLPAKRLLHLHLRRSPLTVGQIWQWKTVHRILRIWKDYDWR
jgi:hypothetical protein